MTTSIHPAQTRESGATLAPRIDRYSGPARLVVDGKPFFVRGIELHNSSSSSEGSTAHGLCTARRVGANTVLAAVTWEDIEPEEGSFDLRSVQSLIDAARHADLKLILLWFGAWKNGSSSYAPAWVKLDWTRFARCVHDDGRLSDTLTPFSSTGLDLAAFEKLTEYVESVDEHERTVLMIQIENEIGLLGSSRDHSDSALAAFHSPLDPVLRAALAGRAGFEGSGALAWSQVSVDPDGRDEAFMASGYASHVQRLAAAGRARTRVPFYVNAWLDSEIELDIPGFAVAGGQRPGTYPSGGPLPRVSDVWTALAPNVDLYAPDVYFGELDTIYSAFTDMTGGLFIPEQRTGEDGVGAAFLAFGEYAAIGVSPFGVDSRTAEEVEALTDGYSILAAASAYFTDESGARAASHGFHLTDEQPRKSFRLGAAEIEVTRSAGFVVDDTGTHGYGLVVRTGENSFVFAGRGFHARFSAVDGSRQVGILTAVELDLVAERTTLRRLNGDETGGGARVIHPPLTRRASPFPIAAGHHHSGLTAVTVYEMPLAGGSADA